MNDSNTFRGYPITTLRNKTSSRMNLTTRDRLILARHAARYQISQPSMLHHGYEELVASLNIAHRSREYPQIVMRRIIESLRYLVTNRLRTQGVLIETAVLDEETGDEMSSWRWPQYSLNWLRPEWDGDEQPGDDVVNPREVRRDRAGRRADTPEPLNRRRTWNLEETRGRDRERSVSVARSDRGRSGSVDPFHGLVHRPRPSSVDTVRSLETVVGPESPVRERHSQPRSRSPSPYRPSQSNPFHFMSRSPSPSRPSTRRSARGRSTTRRPSRGRTRSRSWSRSRSRSRSRTRVTFRIKLGPQRDPSPSPRSRNSSWSPSRYDRPSGIVPGSFPETPHGRTQARPSDPFTRRDNRADDFTITRHRSVSSAPRREIFRDSFTTPSRAPHTINLALHTVPDRPLLTGRDRKYIQNLHSKRTQYEMLGRLPDPPSEPPSPYDNPDTWPSTPTTPPRHRSPGLHVSHHDSYNIEDSHALEYHRNISHNPQDSTYPLLPPLSSFMDQPLANVENSTPWDFASAPITSSTMASARRSLKYAMLEWRALFESAAADFNGDFDARDQLALEAKLAGRKSVQAGREAMQDMLAMSEGGGPPAVLMTPVWEWLVRPRE